jgi:CubicO group peptidase (beta-lactamase class C family)
MRRTLTTLRRSAARVATACLLVLAPVSAAQGQEPFPGLESYITNAVAEMNVPGLSVAIVRNDSVLYTRGFGVLAHGSTERVDEHTRFEIGSSGKAFTAALIAMLVSDGTLRYDDRVSDHLPEFRLADPVANREVTLRDALTHRSGIARGELIWLGSGLTRSEILHRVRHLSPQSPFRSQFSYQNILYLAAGEAAARATGSSWDDLIETRIFGPLGMRASTPATAGLTGRSNIARPHGSIRDSVFIKPVTDMTNIGPAGSIVSTATDMAQWLRFQLGDGAFEGTRLLERGPFREMHTPHILIGSGGGAGGIDERVTRFNSYGLGWMVQDYRRSLMVQHGGNTDGMTAAVGMLPEESFGVVVLANMASSPLPALLTRWIFDRQLDAPPQDHVAEARTRTLAQRVRADSIAAANAGADGGARTEPAGLPPLPLTAYAGTYADSLYGTVVVNVAADALELRRGDWYGPLEYWNGTNFRWTIFPSSPINPLFIKFEVAPDDQVTGVWFGLGDDATLLRRRPTPADQRASGGSR